MENRDNLIEERFKVTEIERDKKFTKVVRIKAEESDIYNK